MAKFNGTRGSAGRIAWVFLSDSASTTGGGKTGLTNASAALNVTVRREKSAAVTTYTGANIGAVATLGTWANPGAGKVNFKEVDAANLPGLYELHFVDVLFDASDTSRWLAGMVTATGVAPAPFEVELDAVDLQDGTAAGLSRLDAAVSSRSTYAGTDTAGTTTLLARITGTLPLASDYTSARAAKLDNLDVAVSTRSAYAGGDTAGTTTLLARLTAGRATNLDNLDVLVSSRSTYAGADTAGTTTLLARLTAGRATNLDNLDAAVSTRLATSGYIVPPAATAIADAVLSRDVSNVEATAPEHSLCYVVLSATEASVTGTTLTVKRTDGATTFATKTLTVSAGASPVTGVA